MSEMNDDELNRLIQDANPSGDSSTIYYLAVMKQSEIIAAFENSRVTWFSRLWTNATRFKKMLISCIAVMLIGVFGTTTTLVARNLLSDSWIQSINESGCDVSGENARLVRSGRDSLGTVIEYWTVGSEKSVVDVIIQKGNIDGASGGTLSCNQDPRVIGQPFISYSAYGMDNQVPHAAFFGWVPIGTTGEIEMSNGDRYSINPDAQGNVLELVDADVFNLIVSHLYVYGSNDQNPKVFDLQPNTK